MNNGSLHQSGDSQLSMPRAWEDQFHQFLSFSLCPAKDFNNPFWFVCCQHCSAHDIMCVCVCLHECVIRNKHMKCAHTDQTCLHLWLHLTACLPYTLASACTIICLEKNPIFHITPHRFHDYSFFLHKSDFVIFCVEVFLQNLSALINKTLKVAWKWVMSACFCFLQLTLARSMATGSWISDVSKIQSWWVNMSVLLSESTSCHISHEDVVWSDWM